MKGCTASRVSLLLCVALAIPVACHAKVDPVVLTAPKPSGWVGQRLAFFIELRGEGPFVGAASFSLPDIPRCAIVKVGDPVVGSEELEDASWFTQTHEFALFSQRDGDVELPPIAVRFSNRKEPGAPTVDRNEKTSPLTFQVKRPDGAEADAFVVTTDDITITEQWDPQPGPAKQGAFFHRTITQEANEVTGIALAPPPDKASNGVRVYLGRPSVSNNVNRGDLKGRRSDTITYVLEAAGTLSAPAIQYVWWDPGKEGFGSKTLPAVTFEVAAPSGPTQPSASEPSPNRWWALGIALAACLPVLWVSRQAWSLWWRRVATAWNPPERAAARRLLKACRRNDAPGAEAAWLQWRSISDDAALQHSAAHLSDRLRTAASQLDRELYGLNPSIGWRGDALASALRSYRSNRRRSQTVRARVLPRLNPTSTTSRL